MSRDSSSCMDSEKTLALDWNDLLLLLLLLERTEDVARLGT